MACHSVSHWLLLGAVLQANWLGGGRETWQECIITGPGASCMNSMLGKHGKPQCLSEAMSIALVYSMSHWRSLCAVLQANWLGDSREAWQERINSGPGASSVNSMLRKHGLPQRLSEALCTELGIQDRRSS